MVFLLQWNKWRSSKIIIYLRLNFNVRQLGGVAPAGGVPTSPGPLDSAMLAKLLFQRCFVQKVELCQITPLSQRMAQKKDRLRAVKPSQSRSARQLSRRASFLAVRQSYPQQKKLPLSGKTSPGRGKMAKPKGGAAGTASAVTERVYFFSCCSCSLRSSRMRFFSLLTWGHGQLKPSLALHQRVSG